MKLENQVVNLDLSKQLKETDYPQKGLFWYIIKESFLTKKSVGSLWYYKENFSGQEICVAPTVAELGEALPENCLSSKNSRSTGEREVIWTCYPTPVSRGRVDCPVTANTEAGCRAKMWLYLKKEKLL